MLACPHPPARPWWSSGGGPEPQGPGGHGRLSPVDAGRRGRRAPAGPAQGPAHRPGNGGGSVRWSAPSGSTAFRRLRVGTEGVRDELERLARRPVVEITADSPDRSLAGAPELVVGTEAAAPGRPRRRRSCSSTSTRSCWLPRYRAAEEATSLLARAARLVGGRRDGGRLMVQTRCPAIPSSTLRCTPIPDGWSPARWRSGRRCACPLRWLWR